MIALKSNIARFAYSKTIKAAGINVIHLFMQIIDTFYCGRSGYDVRKG